MVYIIYVLKYWCIRQYRKDYLPINRQGDNNDDHSDSDDDDAMNRYVYSHVLVNDL